ncbi:metal ABC transporter substrate-binding protein [Aliidongia dinghuensis]|uniref:Metal ABC transporter substrate-binding protein n=1 Tax=Aliidongia dinghuensis TaxID=1867774 RepID=A0A8J3E1A1_9PROT|nr:metal ABC transporter substrate-binding protein [Aliidongia dinghuensis]GGF09988.1 metal ABC transporter substrate-binding protein [Aliidongia dinghuensis]
MRLASLLLALIPFGLAIGTAAADPLPVVATTSVLEDLVKNVGGDKVAVRSLVGPDGDAHTYEPTPSDAKAISSARLVVINGLGLEGWLTRLMGSAGFTGTRVVATEGITPLTMTEEEGGKARKVTDPHAWQSLANGRIYVANIAKGLAAADPANAAVYQQNAEAYAQRLTTLEAKVKAELADVPAAKRRVITTHDAFQYYGKAYGVQFIAPIGLSTEEGEPSAGDVAKLERQIKREKLKALFLENISNSRLIDQLAHDTGAVVGPPLFSDALSKPSEPAPTYIQMFEYNTATLKAGMLLN